MQQRFIQPIEKWVTGLWLALADRLSGPDKDDRERGDVPGWVMITVMTAIVVIALLAVFQDQVTAAVEKAFGKVSGNLPKEP